jgi:hypothetical protein
LRVTALEGPVTLADAGSVMNYAPGYDDPWHLNLTPREFSSSASSQGASAAASFKLERTGNRVTITANTSASTPRAVGSTAAAGIHATLCFEGGTGGRVRVTFECTGTVTHGGWGHGSIHVGRPAATHCLTLSDQDKTLPWESPDGKVVEEEGNCVRDIEISFKANADDATTSSGRAEGVIVLNVERL